MRRRRGRPQVHRGRLGRAALHLDPWLACGVSAWNGNRCTINLLPHSQAQRPPPCLASILSALQATSRRAHATWRAGPTSELPRLTCPTCWCPRTSESGWSGLHGLWASGPGRRALWRDDVRFLRERALAVVPSLPSGCNALAPSMPTCSAFRPPLQHLAAWPASPSASSSPRSSRHLPALALLAPAAAARRSSRRRRRVQPGRVSGGRDRGSVGGRLTPCCLVMSPCCRPLPGISAGHPRLSHPLPTHSPRCSPFPAGRRHQRAPCRQVGPPHHHAEPGGAGRAGRAQRRCHRRSRRARRHQPARTAAEARCCCCCWCSQGWRQAGAGGSGPALCRSQAAEGHQAADCGGRPPGAQGPWSSSCGGRSGPGGGRDAR